MTVTSCFVYKYFRDIESIDHLCINPIRRIGLIHKQSIDFRWHKWRAQVNVLLYNIKQNMTHCHSWLARQYLSPSNGLSITPFKPFIIHSLRLAFGLPGIGFSEWFEHH